MAMLRLVSVLLVVAVVGSAAVGLKKDIDPLQLAEDLDRLEHDMRRAGLHPGGSDNDSGLDDSYLATGSRHKSRYLFKDYKCRVGLKADAADGPVKVKCIAHCRLGSPHSAEGTVKPGETISLSIKKCKSGRARTEIKFDGVGMMRVSIQDKADYCLVKYKFARLIQGYQTVGTDKPCSKADPLDGARPEGDLPKDIMKLVKKFAPRFHMHKKEKYFPASIEHFLEHSELAKFGESSSRKGGKKTVLIPHGKVTMDSLAEKAKADPKHGNKWYLVNDEEIRKGDLKRTKCYVSPVEIPGNAIDISYTVYYPYNYPASKLALGMGEHDGDWEHVTVRVDKSSGRILGMMLSAHGTRESMWMLDQVKSFPKEDEGNTGYMMSGGRPDFWVGAGTHATMNRPGDVRRRYGVKPVRIVPELTSTGGKVLDCHNAIQLVVDPVNKPKDAKPMVTKESVGEETYKKLVEQSKWMWFTGRFGGRTGPSEWHESKNKHKRRVETPFRKGWNTVTKEWRGNGSSSLSDKSYMQKVEGCWPFPLKKGEKDTTREGCHGYHED